MMMDNILSSPMGFAQSAVSIILGRDHPARRDLDEMSIPELEARLQVNEERLRLARQVGWLGGFGGGVVGVFSVAKMVK
jgi:hypothetical protein